MKTFKVGDRVRWPDPVELGTVTEVGLYLTRIQWDGGELSTMDNRDLHSVTKVIPKIKKGSP